MQLIRIVIDAAKAFYEEMFFFLIAGLIGLLSSLLILPAPFALAGIWMIAHRSVRGLGVNWRIIWGSIKEYGLRSLALSAIIVLGYFLLGTNLWFYNTPELSPFSPKFATWTTPLWIILLVLWTCMAFYAEALLLELKEPKLLTIIRNGLALSIVTPFTMLGMLVLCGLLLALSLVVPPLLVALPGFIATLSITAVRTLTQSIVERYEENTEEEAGDGEGETSEKDGMVQQ